ncbi:MAG: hypothetical protein AB7E47_03165 [Desulfovibrionaceae bacterium]
MNTDFRVAVGFARHVKTRKLVRAVGYEAVLALLALWGYAAENKPDGVLHGMDVDDIELAADWAGDCGAFVAALVALGFLDHDGDIYALHDWAQHNAYATHAEDRKERARKGAAARWGQGRDDRRTMPDTDTGNAQSIQQAMPTGISGNAQSIPQAMLTGASGNTPSPAPSPSPSPTPAPKSKEKEPYPPAFESLWKTCHEAMRRCGKPGAFKAWEKARRSAAWPGDDAVLRAVGLQTQQWMGEPNPFVAHLTTWLNNGRWDVGQDVQPETRKPAEQGSCADVRRGRPINVDEERERQRKWAEDQFAKLHNKGVTHGVGS